MIAHTSFLTNINKHFEVNPTNNLVLYYTNKSIMMKTKAVVKGN